MSGGTVQCPPCGGAGVIRTWSSPASCGAWKPGQVCGRGGCPHFHMTSSERCDLCEGTGETTAAAVDAFYQALAVALREAFDV